MSEERVEPKPIDLGEYKFGFHDDVEPVLSTGKGLNEAVIRELSAAKDEPEWMLDFRLKSYEAFKKMPMQTWGPDLSEINFDDLIYYQKASDKPARSWDEVPEKIKETFEKIGIPEAERAYLAGAAAQYESEVVYHNMKEEFQKLGIVFTDTDSALKEYPELFKQYFALVGVFGSIMALVYPVFYPFPFPHVSSVNNVFGHWALLANCLIYLVKYYQVENRDIWKICQMTFSVNAIIFLANLATGGNYGFMSKPPVIGDHGSLLNYLIVTSLMTGILILINQLVKYKHKNS